MRAIEEKTGRYNPDNAEWCMKFSGRGKMRLTSGAVLQSAFVRIESESLFSLLLFFFSHKHLVVMWQHCLGTQL